MAVIINDFEVVVETPTAPAEPGADTAAPAPSPAPKLTPHDLHELERHRMERAARVWAH
ncbi:MAG: hypothetical protein MPN21_11840 [Thermoanaerobaculia bacterium]|nr:hypothetical protein [Thermoanaerobaculia bacterium]